MKINRKTIFAILILAIIFLSSVIESYRNNKKSKSKKSKAKKLNRLANRLTRLMSEHPNPFAWKEDKFLVQLKDQLKYKYTANTRNKWTLFRYLIGKTLVLLGVDSTVSLKYIQTLSQIQSYKIVILLMKFQKSMDLTQLNPLLDLKIPGLTSANFLPLGRQKVLNFLNSHLRVAPAWH